MKVNDGYQQLIAHEPMNIVRPGTLLSVVLRMFPFFHGWTRIMLDTASEGAADVSRAMLPGGNEHPRKARRFSTMEASPCPQLTLSIESRKRAPRSLSYFTTRPFYIFCLCAVGQIEVIAKSFGMPCHFDSAYTNVFHVIVPV